MGSGCSKSKPPKTAADLLLEEIQMEETNVQKLDDVFLPAGELSSAGIENCNGMISVREKIVIAAAVLKGASQLVLSRKGEPVCFSVITLMDEGQDQVLAVCKGKGLEVQKKDQFAALSSATGAIKAVADSFGKVVAAAAVPQLELAVSRGLLIFTAESKKAAKEARKNTKKAHKELISFNRSLIAAQAALAKQAFKGDLKDAIREIKNALQEHLKEKFAPRVDVSMDKLTEGELALDVSFGGEPSDLARLPKRVRKCYDALLCEEEGEEGLIPFIKASAKRCVKLQEEGRKAHEAAKNLPTDRAGVQEMASGLSVTQTISLPMKMTTNIRNTAQIPEIVKNNFEMMKRTVREIQESMMTAKNKGEVLLAQGHDEKV